MPGKEVFVLFILSGAAKEAYFFEMLASVQVNSAKELTELIIVKPCNSRRIGENKSQQKCISFKICHIEISAPPVGKTTLMHIPQKLPEDETFHCEQVLKIIIIIIYFYYFF